MERIDDLGVKNLKLIQNTDLFCFWNRRGFALIFCDG